jgi:hypothetical protein
MNIHMMLPHLQRSPLVYIYIYIYIYTGLQSIFIVRSTIKANLETFKVCSIYMKMGCHVNLVCLIKYE